MLSNLSWKEYAELITLANIIYYVVIALIYYRKDIRELYRAKIAGTENVVISREQEGTGVNEIPNPYYTPTLDELEELLADIKTNILERAGISAGKAALLTELKARLANYDGLRQPAYQDAFNRYIIQNAQELCGVTFSEQELRDEWSKLLR